jgi:hypothetical protein
MNDDQKPSKNPPVARFRATSPGCLGWMGMNRILTITAIAALSATGVACLSSDQLRRREFDAQYRQALQLCGHPDAAFQAGYNAGYAGDPMRGEWSANCVPSAQPQALAAYQNGFLQGGNNAPIRVVHTITPIQGRATASTSVAQCTFDSDCGGGGFHCRDHACMGNGWIGERCVFNDDCSSDHCFGGTCRE